MLATLREYPHFVHFIGLMALAAWYAGVFPRGRSQPRFRPLLLYCLVGLVIEVLRWSRPTLFSLGGPLPLSWELAGAAAAGACLVWALFLAPRDSGEPWPRAHRLVLLAHFLLTFAGHRLEAALPALQSHALCLPSLASVIALSVFIGISLPLARRGGSRLHWSMVFAVLVATCAGYLLLRSVLHSALQRTEGSLMERTLSIAAALDPVEVDALVDRPNEPSERLVEALMRVRTANPDVVRILLLPGSTSADVSESVGTTVRRRIQAVIDERIEFTLVEEGGYLTALARVRGLDRVAAVLLIQHNPAFRDRALHQASLNGHFTILFICCVVLACIAGYQRVVRLVDRRSSLLDATATVAARLSGGEDPADTARWLTSFLYARLDVLRADVWITERRENKLGFTISATSPDSAPLHDWIACHELPESWHLALCAGQPLDAAVPALLPAGLETSRAARRLFAEPIAAGSLPWGAIVIFSRRRLTAETVELRNALRTLSTSFSSALVRRERTNLLRAAEERFRLILDTSIDGFWDMDFTSGHCYHSPRWWDMLGYQPNELPDDLATTRDLVHPTDVAALNQSAAEHLPPGVRPLQHQVRMRHRDGRWLWIEASAVEVRTAAGPAQRALGFDREITERRLADERLRDAVSSAEQANRTKSEFLAAMSHELRTPLNTVIGLSSLLQRSALTPRQSEWVEATQTSAEQLLALINDLLDLSKIEAGRLELRHAAFELRTTVERIVALFAKDAGDKSLALDCVFHAPLGPVWVAGDELRLRQILTNLIANALKFTTAGRVWIEIHRGTGNLWEFAVHDTGPGIPEDKIGQLFQRFSQLDANKSSSRTGTGLGLAISRELVQQMGGEIGVESSVGRGSVFHFSLVLDAAEGPARRNTDRPDFSGSSVVVWDADPVDQASLDALFSGTGLEMQACADESVLASQLVRRPECVAVLFPRAFLPSRRAVAHRLRLTHRDGGRVRLIALHTKSDQAPDDPDFDVLMPSPPRQRALFELFLGHHQHRPSAAARSLAPLQVDGILVAEDHPSNRLVMQAMLASLNLHAHFVADGALAVEAMRQRQFSCALVDIGMPVLDGLGVARWVRDQWDCPWPRPRVIAVTAFASHHDRDRFLEGGMDDVLAKPFTREELHRALAQVTPLSGDTTPGEAPPVESHGIDATAENTPRLAADPEKESPAPAAVASNPSDDVAWDRLESLMETTNARRNAAIFRRIIANFREQTTQELVDLARLPDDDRAAALRALHRFKGALSSLSLRAAAQQVTTAHDAGFLPPLAERAAWIEELRTLIDRSLAEIHTRYPWLDEPTP
jgi:PAS domain S-box-containing protein